jgi:hypothetical protein
MTLGLGVVTVGPGMIFGVQWRRRRGKSDLAPGLSLKIVQIGAWERSAVISNATKNNHGIVEIHSAVKLAGAYEGLHDDCLPLVCWLGAGRREKDKEDDKS